MLIFFFAFIISLLMSIFVYIEFLSSSAIIIAIYMIINYSYRIGQIEDKNKISMLLNKKHIYRKMVDEQLIEFKKYLGDYYPNIEKEIFNSIKPENLNLYFVKYPEIKSDQTITELVRLINEKTSKIYKYDLESEEIKTRIKTRYEDSKAWCVPNLIKP